MPSEPQIVSLIDRSAQQADSAAAYPGLHLYRVTKPSPFEKTRFHGTRLVVIAQGRKVAHVRGKELLYDSDHYLVMSGQTEVQGFVVEASPERPYLAACLDLPAELVAKNLLALAGHAPRPSTPLDVAQCQRIAFVSAHDAGVASAFARLLGALRDPLDRKVVAPLAMEELVFRLLRTEAAAMIRGAVQVGDGAIAEAMSFMRQNAQGTLTVEQVARHVAMSPSHFAHRFSAVARTTPMRYLKHLRLEAARDLLLTQRVRASEAALRVGYESTSHFNRDFKAAYGAAPASYARQMLAG